MDARERYQQYRSTDQELMQKVARGLKPSAMNRAAQMLDVGQSGVMRTEPETAIYILIDFASHDIRRGGKSAVQQYRDGPGPESEVEADLLTAHVLATTSLYKVIETGLSDDMVLLRDLLRTADDVRLTDINLSRSARPGWLIFARFLLLDGLSMTSGMTFAFPAQVESDLLADYQQRLRQIDLAHDERRRFVHFFKEFDTRGMPTRYKPVSQ